MHFLIGLCIVLGIIYFAIIDEAFRKAVLILIGIIVFLLFLLLRH